MHMTTINNSLLGYVFQNGSQDGNDFALWKVTFPIIIPIIIIIP